jgi:hypothetical protein
MVENGTNNPIATGSIITAGNYFIEGYFDGVYDQGKEINDSDELDAVMSASGVYATYGFDRLEAVTDEAEALFDDQAIYAVLSWERLINTYNEVIDLADCESLYRLVRAFITDGKLAKKFKRNGEEIPL